VALGKSWEAKRALAAGVSNQQLDDAVEGALAVGATGAKVAGAGGGGFVLVSCPLECQTAVREAMGEMKELPIKIDAYGSRVIFNQHRDIWG
jgi:D-glycero-alpha-D-manno-heptose-7-phosphate kinase